MGDDKFGGRPVHVNRAIRLWECLDRCKIIDIGFSEPRHTWSNLKPLTVLIQEKINRVFINIEWNALYSEAVIKHLERVHSDHYPIILSIHHDTGLRLTQPFRFQPMWLSHPSFPEVVRDLWGEVTSLSFAISSFTLQAREWHRNIFGNLFQMKNRIRARLRGIQENLENQPNDYLINLEKDLRAKFSTILKLEKEFWAIKARISRLVEGDRNTVFYHTLALVHQRRNRITTMKNRMGNWIHGDSEIDNHIRNGFLKLFSTNHCSTQLAEWAPPFWQAGLHEANVTHLEGPLTNVEIRFTLWSLNPYKAPEPDGLHAGFFQRF